MKIKNFEKLNEIEKKIVVFLVEFLMGNGYTPTLKQIVAEFAIKRKYVNNVIYGYSPTWAQLHLINIEQKGVIEREKNPKEDSKMPTIRRKIRPIKINFLDKIIIDDDIDDYEKTINKN